MSISEQDVAAGDSDAAGSRGSADSPLTAPDGQHQAAGEQQSTPDDRAAVLRQLAEVAVEVLGIDASIVEESSRFNDDLGADSLDLVEVVMGLEEHFSITIPEERLDGITTVGQAIDLVLSIVGDPTESADGA